MNTETISRSYRRLLRVLVQFKIKKRKSKIVLLIFAVVLAFVQFAEAQPAAKIPQIGFLAPAFYSSISERIEGFRQGLRKLGYGEGQNILIEYRFAEGKADRLPDLAAELVQLNVACIVTVGTPATRAAKQAAGAIPIVMGNADDPVGQGFVNSLAQPGGNITGLTDNVSELAGKRLELLKEAVSKLSRVAVLWTPGPPGFPMWEESQRTARQLGLQVHSIEIRSVNDIESAFTKAIKARSNGLVVAPTPLLSANQNQIADLAKKHRLPAMWPFRQQVDAGGLMSYGPNMADLYIRAAAHVDKILKGTKPAEIPVERPMKFDLVINLNSAKQIGLTIPPYLLARTDKVLK